MNYSYPSRRWETLRRCGDPIELSIERVPGNINEFLTYLVVIVQTHATNCGVLWLVKNARQQSRRVPVG